MVSQNEIPAERQVVVNIQYLVEEHSEDKVIAVRFPALGLTAYGETENEAVHDLKQLFNKFVHTYRNAGLLEEVLNRAGVEWWWRGQYPADRPEVEDTNVSGPTPASLRVIHQKAWHPIDNKSGRDSAVAA